MFSGVSWINQAPFAEPANYSLHFDHELDAVIIPAPTGSPLDVFDKLTLEAHIQPQDTSSLHFILWADDGPFSLLIRNDAIEFGLNHQTVIVHPFRAAGIWTHVAAVYDGTVARLYLNGVEVASNTIVLGPIGPVESRNIIRIGNDETAEFPGFDRDFGGFIDQVRIVSGALTPAEILYDATHTLISGASSDCNGNEIPDDCESDGDGDGTPDDCDVCEGLDDGADADGDMIPDACDRCGDFDGDQLITNADFAQLPEYMSDPTTFPTPQLPLTTQRCQAAFDCDLDGDVDLSDYQTLQVTLDGP